MVNGGKITPDYVYSDCSSLPYHLASYPIVVVNGDCNISGGVEFDGTLIVTGNLTLGHGGSGDPQMRGMMLVGQNFNSSGGSQGWGMVVSGLNQLGAVDAAADRERQHRRQPAVVVRLQGDQQGVRALRDDGEQRHVHRRPERGGGQHPELLASAGRAPEWRVQSTRREAARGRSASRGFARFADDAGAPDVSSAT